ncbi:MAG: biosynthetic-type acetolactate synthase large subunit [Nanoarchaeota archaeon]|nr:biosynthetic-type acetolactate synthase large subunit [Nanoarchaeota archaeon]
MKGNEVLVKTLIKKDVDKIFGITGGAVIPLYDSLYRHKDKITTFMCRHEQGAAHMASGYARVTGKPGVVVATSGPGGTNIVTGIMDAYMDSTPMIAMGGQVPVRMIGGDSFQETDMMGITMPITKHNFQIRNPEKLSETILKAFKIATEGRPGPVYIDLPKDVQTQDVRSEIPDSVSIPSYKPISSPNPLPIKKAVELISGSERPMIIAGGGCIIADAQKELFDFVEASSIPISTTTMGKGIFPERHDLSLGVIGMHGEEFANYAAINTDCLISIGCRFSDRITGSLKTFCVNAKIIHADIDPSEIGKNVKVDVPIVGDAKEILKMLMKEYSVSHHKKKDISAWVKKLQELKKATLECEEKEMEGMTQANMLNIFDEFKNEDDIVVTGVGQHQMFGMHYLTFSKPKKWLTSGGAGTMGYGLPAALGAKIGAPQFEVYDIDGDGSFQMTVQELSTAKQYGIKVIVIIMNNGHLGMVRQWLEIFQDSRYSNVVFGDSNPDFVALAKAYKLDGIKVTKESEFVEALKLAKKSKETFIIDVHVKKDENILPMVPPGRGLHQSICGRHIFTKKWEDVKNVQ